MGKTKKYLLVLCVLLVITVIFLAVAPYFIDINRYRPAITDLLSRQLNRSVTIQDLRLSLIAGPSVVVSDVTIADAHRPDHPLITTPEIRVGFALLPLLAGDVVIRRVVLAKPQIMLVRYQDGSLNTDGLGMMEGEKTSTGSPSVSLPSGLSIEIREVLIRSISIKDGTFAYLKEEANAQDRTLVSLNGIDLDAHSIIIPTPTSSKSGGSLVSIGAEIKAGIDSGAIGSVPFTRLSLSGSVTDGAATVVTLKSTLFGGDLTASGKTPLEGSEPNGVLTLRLSGANANEMLNAFSGRKDTLWGTLDLTGDYTFPITGFSDGLAGSGKISLTDGYVRDFSLRDELAKSLGIPSEALPKALDTGAYRFIGGDYLIRSRKVTSNDLTVDGAAFTAVGAGYVGFDKSLDISGTITLREIAVISSLYSAALSLVGVSGSIDKFPFRVSGTLDNAEFSIPFVSGVERGVGNIFKSLEGDILR